MNKKKLIMYLFFLLSFIPIHNINSQPSFDLTTNMENLLLTPNVAGLIKFIDIPVSKYTGLPNIEIPVYTIKGRDIEIPITLSYHAGGIKVDEEASWVGLGWTLSVGGSITRIIRGMDDDMVNTNWDPLELPIWPIPTANWVSRYCSSIGSAEQYEYGISTVTPIDVLASMGELQPDIYYYSALGESNRFFYDFRDQKAYFEKPTNYIINGYTVTKDDGTVLIFDELETKYNIAGTTPIASETYYLTSIITPRGNEAAHFYYTEGSEYVYQTPIEQEYRTEFRGQPCVYDIVHNSPYLSYQYKPSFLDSIVTQNFIVIFNKENRQDITNEKRLASIMVIDKSSGQSRTFIFDNNHYFTSTDGSLNKRLKLNSFCEQGLPPYTFQYNPVQLPDKKSKAVDYWNYYNGVNNGDLIPSFSKLAKYDDFYFDPSFGGSANRGADEYYMKACILEKITYPTGGYTEFEYEAHSFSNYLYEDANIPDEPITHTHGGGLRIKNIRYVDGTKEITKSYVYEYTQNGNVYSYGRLINPLVFYESVNVNNYGPECLNQFTKFTSSSVNTNIQLFSANGSLIGYDRVDEYIGDSENNGYITSIYFNQENIRNPIYCSYRLTNGLLKEEYTYNKNNDLVKYKKINYTEFPIHSFFSVDVIIHTYPEIPVQYDRLNNWACGFEYIMTPIVSQMVLPNRIEESMFYNGEELKTILNYTYNDYFQLQEQINVGSDNTELITKYQYPLDYATNTGCQNDHVNAINSMVEKNMINQPVETIKIKQGTNGVYKVIDAQVTKYKRPNNIPMPFAVYKLETINPINEDAFVESKINNCQFYIDSHYSLDLIFDHYDNSCNLLQYHKTDDLYTSFVWGYNNSLPIAKAIGAKKNEIFFDGMEEDNGEWLIDYWNNCPTTYNNLEHTGSYSLKTSSTSSCENFSDYINVDNLSGVTIKFSGWIYSSGPNARIHIFYNKSTTPTRYATGWYNEDVYINMSKLNQWQYIETIIYIPPDAKWMYFRLDNLGGAGSVWFDDIRAYPVDAQMNTYTYDPLYGMTSQTGPDGITTYYEYDSFGRLARIKNNDGDILEEYKYHYIETTP